MCDAVQLHDTAVHATVEEEQQEDEEENPLVLVGSAPQLPVLFGVAASPRTAATAAAHGG